MESLSEKFDRGFQTRAVAALTKDAEFCDRIADILEPDYFDGEALTWIAKKTLEFQAEFRDSPTLVFFQNEVKQIDLDSQKESVVQNLRKVWQSRDSPDLDYVKRHLLSFCKRQKVVSAVHTSVDLLDRGEYDAIKATMDDALKAGMERNIGHDYKADCEDRLSGVARNTIPTGFGPIDTRILDGGLAGGEIGVIMAPTGAGKSWLLSAIGVHNLKAGRNVAHLTLELSELQTGFRYDSVLCGYPPNEIQDHKAEVREALKQVSGELQIQAWPTGGASTQTVRSWIDRMETLKWKPDIILLDYADLMRALSSQNFGADGKYEQMGAIYEDLRGLSGETDIPVWTVSQTQRSAVDQKVIKANKVADSWKKLMTADAVFSLSRTDDDKISGTGRIHAIKSRFGPDGITFPVRFNTGAGAIEVVDPDTDSGKQLLSEIEMKSETRKKEAISKKWQQYKHS